MRLTEAFGRLSASLPGEEDPVVCHGDYCFPSVLVEGNVVTSYLDVSERLQIQPMAV